MAPPHLPRAPPTPPQLTSCARQTSSANLIRHHVAPPAPPRLPAFLPNHPAVCKHGAEKRAFIVSFLRHALPHYLIFVKPLITLAYSTLVSNVLQHFFARPLVPRRCTPITISQRRLHVSHCRVLVQALTRCVRLHVLLYDIATPGLNPAGFMPPHGTPPWWVRGPLLILYERGGAQPPWGYKAPTTTWHLAAHGSSLWDLS